MTTLISRSDITDELIKTVITAAADDAFLAGVDSYLLDLLQGFDSTLTLSSIPSPLPYKVKQLAIIKCCYDVCVAKFGGQAGVYFKGQEGEDRWYTKLRFYQSKVSELEGIMTLELMTGAAKTGKSFSSIPIWRC